MLFEISGDTSPFKQYECDSRYQNISAKNSCEFDERDPINLMEAIQRLKTSKTN